MKINIKRYKVKERMKKIMTQAQGMDAIRGKDYMIGSLAANGTVSFSPNPAIHEKWNEVGVRAECKRLARENPGKIYFYVQMVGGEMVVPQPSTVSL